MLAQNFKTAEQLGIGPDLHEALIKVLGMLERGELRHVDPESVGGFPLTPSGKFTGHFNMAVWNAKTHCGTVCCIGGTAELLMGRPINECEETNLELDNLFFMPRVRGLRLGHLANVTVAMAATALRNYLTLGEPKWEEVS